MARQCPSRERTHRSGGPPRFSRLGVTSGLDTGASDQSHIGAVMILGLLFAATIAHAQQHELTQAQPKDVNATRAETPLQQVDPNLRDKLVTLLDEELRLAEQLVKAFPDKEEPLVLVGNVHSRRGHVDQADNFWEKALQMNPRRADVVDKMANLALEMDQLEKAVGLWRRVLELNPGAQDIHYNLATALMRLGKYRESIEEAHQEIKISGDKAQSYFLLGQTYQHLEDYEKAKENYQRVIALQPDHVKACYALYVLCARLKHPEEAKLYLERFQALKSKHQDAVRRADESMMSDLEVFYDSLARFFFDTARFSRDAGKSPEVEDVLRKAFALGQESTAFLGRLAMLYSATNRVQEALALYLKAAKMAPNDKSYQLNVGILSVRIGRFDNAETAFRRAIELAPGDYAGYQELARLYLRMKVKLPEARRLAQKTVELAARADTYYDLGVANLMSDDPNGALTAVNKAIELEPGNTNYVEMGNLLRKKKGGK